MQQVSERVDMAEQKNQVMYYLPIWARMWLKEEAERRGVSASALIVDLVRKEQEQEAA